ncbi:MAG: DUF898 family protein [Bacteroidota bacterium]
MANGDEPSEEAGGAAGAASVSGMPGIAIGAPPVLRLSYRGIGWDLFGVLIVNTFLTLVTLGIYAPWARTRRRKYVWRHVEIENQVLDYTGTGKELFLGYLKVAAVYLLLFVVPQVVVARISRPAGLVMQAIAGVVLMVVVPFAIYWSRRYLLSRTRWRGIRFGLGGEAKPFAKQFIGGTLLTVVTLGLYGPVFANRIYGTLMRNTRYGNKNFRYDGPDREAFFIGLKGFLLTIVTLGIYFCWYRANVSRFRMSHTHIDGATVRFGATGGLLFKLTLINVFANAFTLGIAFPWTFSYTLREILGQITVEGPIDFARITQLEVAGDAVGDSLASSLGVELGV